MTTTYQIPPLATYDRHVLPSYPQNATQVRGAAPTLNEAHRAPHVQRMPQTQSTFAPSLPRDPASGTSQYSTMSRHSTRPSSPSSGANVAVANTGSSGRNDSQALIHHCLQIPTCINPKGGNLANFAAEVTCLFWFESMETLRAAESIRSKPASASIPKLAKYAVPHTAFKKWAYQILSTTQVTQSVILLALLFVYRLKKANPSVKGRPGSEYRLLTVALMLGNKFLDDNTYTNKTWAEVSGISVQEIHVMEVEFLSNMRYSLLATKDQWEDWLTRLACFSEYYERAIAQPTSPVALSPTTNPAFSSPLVSPSMGTQAAPTIPERTLANTYSPTAAVQASGQPWHPSFQNPVVSPLQSKSYASLPAKRRSSEDEVAAEHPAKRVARQAPGVMTGTQVRPPVVGEHPIRLPVPNLSVITTAQPTSQPPYLGANSYSSAGPSQVSLPPLVPGMRAMATVYPQQPMMAPTPAQVPQLPLPPATTAAPTMMQASLTPTSGVGPQQVMGYGTPGRRQSPGMLGTFGSSPMADSYQAASAVHTPISHTPMSHSPSIYLQQRQSPYKPIRHVNTLLFPPPSSSLHEYHLSVPPPQMHYLPLGRRNDLRTGIVPDYMGMTYRNGPMGGHMPPQGQHPGQHPGQ